MRITQRVCVCERVCVCARSHRRCGVPLQVLALTLVSATLLPGVLSQHAKVLRILVRGLAKMMEAFA